MDDKDVLAMLVWLTKDGHRPAIARLDDALALATPLERLRVAATLANSQIRTFLSAKADETVGQLVATSSAVDVARAASISVTMVHRRNHRAGRRRAQAAQAAREGD